VPSRRSAVPAEAGIGRRGPCQSAVPAEAGIGMAGFGVSRACRSKLGGSDRVLGACRSRSVGPGRVCGACRSRHRGTRGTMGSGSRSCPGHRDRWAGPAEAGFAGPATVVEGGVNRRSTSQAEAGSVPTEVGAEPEDRALGPVDAPIRRSGPPHHREGPGPGRCGAFQPRLGRPFPPVRRSSRQPSVEPVARFQGQLPSGGAADFKALLR
jgi:hypothetical protein